jgi:hypothetical protein
MPFIEDHVEEYSFCCGGWHRSIRQRWQSFSVWRNIRLGILIWGPGRGKGGNSIAALLEERRQPLSARADGQFLRPS